MNARTIALRSFAALAVVGGTTLFSNGTVHAGGCGAPAPQVIYVPVRPVYVQPAPVVRKVIVIQSAPVYRPSCY